MTDITHDAPTSVPDYHNPNATGHEHEHAHGTGIYWIVFLALMVLLLATVGAAYINMGRFNVPVAFSIATLKALLVLWFFMHLNESTRLTQVFAFASFVWLALLLVMTGGDYVSRHLLPRADERTLIRGVDSYEKASGVTGNRVGPNKHAVAHPVTGETPHAGDTKAGPADVDARTPMKTKGQESEEHRNEDPAP